MALEQDRRISEVVDREQSRLRNFIRRRVPDPRDVGDILQDVSYELVEANRLLMPIGLFPGLQPPDYRSHVPQPLLPPHPLNAH